MFNNLTIIYEDLLKITEQQQDNIVLASTQTKVVTNKDQNNNSVVKTKNRKCNDILCLIIAVLYLTGMIVIIFSCGLTNFDKAKVPFQGYDFLRRGCGVEQVYDALATDYSDVLTSVKYFQPFCNILTSAGQLSDYNCDNLDTSNTNLSQNSRQFFRSIRSINNNMQSYQYGYHISNKTICLAEENQVEKPAYMCTSEFIKYYNTDTGESIDENKQVFTTSEMLEFSDKLSDDNKYLIGFCAQIPDNGQFQKRKLQEKMGIKYYVFAEDKNGDSIVDQLTYLGKDLGTVFTEQTRSQYDTIIYGIGFSILITIIYFIISRFCVKITVWLSILGLFIVLLYGGIVLLLNGKQIGQQIAYEKEYFGQDDQLLIEKKQLYDGFGWTLIALTILVFLITLCCLNTIRIATGVIEQTMVALGSVPQVFIQPIIGVLCCIIWFGFVLTFGYSIYLQGQFDSKQNQFDFVDIYYDENDNLVRKQDGKQIAIFVFWVFGGIWGLFFIYGFNEYMVNVIVSQWYFTQERTRKNLKGSFCNSLTFTFKATGTICVTSFITSLVVLIRFILDYVLKRLQQSNKISDSKAMKVGICLIKCFMKMLQKITQWINRNVQIYSAITGDGYCKSMKNSVKLLLSRILSSLFAKTLTNICLFLGQVLSVAGGCVLTAYITYRRQKEIFWAPVLISLTCCGVLSFYLFEIVEVAVDTIYFSFLYEETYLLREREQTGIIYAPGDLKSLLK